MPLLQINNLATEFDTDEGRVRAVDDVSFSAERGQTLGIVGESGCGKSVTALSIMRLLPQPMGQIVAGNVEFQGTDLTRLTIAEMEKVRGARIGMVFQEPMTALNPVHTIGRQLTEGLLLHKEMTAEAATRAGIEILDRVGIPSPDVRMGEYPHQLSGGMRQRVVIAMALACGPDLLIADEPTTALDVTVEARILDLIQDLQKRRLTSVLYISHDLSLVRRICDRVAVMYAGRIVELGSTDEIFTNPRHPYTRGLMKALPSAEAARGKLLAIPGTVPELINPPNVCRFASRCSYAAEACGLNDPELENVSGSHAVACFIDNQPMNGKRPTYDLEV